VKKARTLIVGDAHDRFSNSLSFGNRAEPKNLFSALLFKRDEPANFRHPALIDLPDRSEQHLRGPAFL